SSRFAKYRHVLLGNCPHLHVRVRHYMRCFSFSQQHAVTHAQQCVSKMHQRFANVLHVRAHDDFIVISCWSLVTAARIHHGNEAAVILFHVAIGKSQLPQQFHAAHFKPDEMIGVIDHPHLIGFRITHSQPHLANMITHFPLQRGLRFSRNDVTPSRKSAVCRIAAFCSIACSICRSSASAMNPFTSFFVARTDDGLFSVSCPATSRAREIRRSAAIISFTRPKLCASVASNILPVISRSRATLCPTCQTRIDE